MSTLKSVSLNQLFKNLTIERNGGKEPLVPITIDPLDPIIYKNTVSVLTHKDRKSAAQLANYISSEFLKTTQKLVFHICLEEHLADVSFSYISLFGNEKLRHLKNKNYPLEKIAKGIEKYSQRLSIIPMKNDQTVITQIMTEVQGLVSNSTGNLLVLEGIDKLLSQDQREVVMSQLLSQLKTIAISSQISIMCVFKEEGFKNIDDIQYFSISNQNQEWQVKSELDSKTKELIKTNEYLSFFPNFNKFPIADEGMFISGYNESTWKTLPFPQVDHLILLQPNWEFYPDDVNDLIKTIYSLNKSCKESSFFIGSEDDKKIFNEVPESNFIDSNNLVHFLELVVAEIKLRELNKDLSLNLKNYILYITHPTLKFKDQLSSSEMESVSNNIIYISNYGKKNGVLIIHKLLSNSAETMLNLPRDRFRTLVIGNGDRSEKFIPKEFHLELRDIRTYLKVINPQILDLIPEVVSHSEKQINLIDTNPFFMLKDDMGQEIKIMEELLASGILKDKMCLGLDENTYQFKTVNPLENPGSLLIGTMGSGKTMASQFTLLTHIISNSVNTKYFIYDPIALDQKYLTLGSNVNIVKNTDEMIKLIEVIWDEMTERSNLFKQSDSNYIKEHESKTKTSMARIVICVENLSASLESAKINYSYKKDTQGTIAHKMRNILRMGRSYGISFIATSSRISSDELSTDLKADFSNIIIFRVNDPSDVAFLGSKFTLASKLSLKDVGRGISDTGFIQIPRLSEETQKYLISKYVEKFKADILTQALIDFIKGKT